MQKGLGIAALVIAIIAIFIPFIGTWLTILVALMAAFAYGEGLGLGIASIIVNIVHIFFFSPLLWVTQGMAEIEGAVSGKHTPFLPWILIVAQVVAIVILFMLQRKSSGFSIIKSPLQEQAVASGQPSLKPPRRMQVDGYAPPTALSTPRAILLGISGPLHGHQFRMETDVFHIGASQKNDLVIAKDDYVSRNHACLRYDKGSLWLADQHSRNGTFLNENRLKGAPLMLNVGDRIRLGNSTFEVIG